MNTAGIISSSLSAYWLVQSSDALSDDQAYLLGKYFGYSAPYESARAICETSALLSMVAACSCLFPFVAQLLKAIISSATNGNCASDAGKRLRLRLFVTFATLTLAFVLNAAHSMIVAYGEPAPPMHSRATSPNPFALIHYLIPSPPTLPSFPSLVELPLQSKP
jgi:hypothetical protein